MARLKMMTSKDLGKMRVLGGKKGTKRIGKVKYVVFHPTARRCVGFVVKRPDFLWMFHRKDLFVAIDGFDFVDGRLVIKDDAETSGPAACRRLGLDFDKCVIWAGMPLMTADEHALGVVGNVTFSMETGEVESVEASNGATAKLLLGTLEVPRDYIVGFRRGIGVDLTVREDSRDMDDPEQRFKGAIVVSDDVWELSPEGGWAEAAGEQVARARARAQEVASAAKPKFQEAKQSVTDAAREGIDATKAQVAATTGMFSGFKEGFDAAMAGDDDPTDEVDAPLMDMFSSFKDEFQQAAGTDRAAEEPKPSVSGMFAAFKEEYDKARAGDDEPDDEYDEDEDGVDDDEYDDEYEDDEPRRPAKKQSGGLSGMFSAFKDEFDKALNED